MPPMRMVMLPSEAVWLPLPLVLSPELLPLPQAARLRAIARARARESNFFFILNCSFTCTYTKKRLRFQRTKPLLYRDKPQLRLFVWNARIEGCARRQNSQNG